MRPYNGFNLFEDLERSRNHIIGKNFSTNLKVVIVFYSVFLFVLELCNFCTDVALKINNKCYTLIFKPVKFVFHDSF